ncbi:bifunctional phosphopantothenoylcysteine decarboxylase/phosphopantothenate--cysteine ligase CoaBC [uncultured Aquimonas sp.]|uniref:bifunctional phosphopantothenoylcysteine decarboxylase/phosphopantothenate--cysteine ligase CoaBC n=2 Tax=Pseudomonadota TaxID=1224 RepID=UPI00086CB5B2|nr:bifunctional phosphopantothenoylcysteine decarboxylase/phosphopantothenate--cysteine ligase CoaBC [uncultured Aquimonas sp.]ODU46364.1 MAG: phosphopantothenoylcysteine decarboxylase [Xanthomonadaceae bacterium SCN 69-123]
MTAAPSARRILLGVSGGIAAYKSAELVRLLRAGGAEVQVVMTASAAQFIGPLTLQALSGRPVRDSLWDAAAEAAMGHIELARWADLVLIAPATADLLARLAQGRADDLLTTLCLASDRPLWLAPAMNRLMWAHPATRANIELLSARGARVLGPSVGAQACGETGEGRMLEPGDIAAAALAALAPRVAGLAGRRVLINAGPTFEDIDPVRFLGNRSSGKMGFALAEAAAASGAEVTLVAGPVVLATPPGVQRINVRSAAQMREAVLDRLDGMDVFIAAAAVADYRPRECAEQKIKKSTEAFSIDCVRNPDIVAEAAARQKRPLVVGFAAETREVEAYARDKLERKGLDLIAANDVAAPGLGFESESNALTVLWKDGRARIETAPKAEVARLLLEIITERLGARA